MKTATRNAWRALAAEPMPWVGNVPRVMGDEATAWLVQSGAVAVFGGEIRDGKPVGPRRFLFRIGEGHGFISVPRTSTGLRLLVVPVVDSEVLETPLAAMHAAINDGSGSALAGSIDGWIRRLAHLLPKPTEPDIVVPSHGGDTLTLEPGWAVRPNGDDVIWIHADADPLRLGNADDATLALCDGTFPLATGLWATSPTQRELVTSTTDRVATIEQLETGLEWLHVAVLDHIQRATAEQDARDRDRLLERARRQRQDQAAALEDLASLTERRRGLPSRATPLLTAMAAIGEELGVAIVEPARTDDARRALDPIDAIAQSSRIRSRRVELGGRWWKQDCGPLLAFRDDEEGRPLALLRRGGRYEIYDPVDRSRTRVGRANAATLATEAVSLYRPFPPGPMKLWNLGRFSLAPHRKDFAFAIMVGVLATLLGMAAPQATAWLMDDAIPDANRRLLIELGLALTAAAFGSVLFSLAQSLVLLRIGTASEVGIQSAVWDRLLRLQPSFFRRYSTGDLWDRVSAVTQVGRQLNGAAIGGLFSSALALLNLFLLLYYSPQLVLLAIALAAVTTLVTATSGRIIRKTTKVLLEKKGEFRSFVVEVIQGVAKLQVAGAEQRAYTRWVHRYTEQLRLTLQNQGLEDAVAVFNQVMPTVGTVGLFWLAAGLLTPDANGAGLTLGTFLAFNTAFGTFLGALTGASGTLIGLLDTISIGQRIRPILEAVPESDDELIDPGQLTGQLAVHNLDFSYRVDAPQVLSGVSLHAEPGESIAIVGPSGSGKSTLVRLLLGFETPTSGSIHYDGQDLATLDVAAVRRQIGVVMQDGKLSQGSIAFNITGGLAVPMDDVHAAAEAAGFAEDLAALPMGLLTLVSEGGGNLSGGQRQRLLIARALVLRPRVLVLDEATSALDNKTQAIVAESLRARNVTRIAIAHRLSTVRDADRIYVLEEGRVVEAGGFGELMEEGGLFARMMGRQMA
ncbi:MAG: NHLP bacteriocin export ABC transporter permease/ATPase subunit [Planctomycetota bacterium]